MIECVATMRSPDATPPPEEPVQCWVCAAPIPPGEERSLLGLGVLLVHASCYERELGLKKTRETRHPPGRP